MADVTLKDVADLVGLNISTVSRALSDDRSTLVNPATRAKVVAAAEKLGYRRNLRASSLRSGRTGTIGVVMADLSNPYIGPTLRGISSSLARRNQLPFMSETGDSSDRLREVCTALLDQRVDGIITTAGRGSDAAFLRQVAREVPLVLAVRSLPDSGLYTITHDDRRGGALAAQHLIELGHRQIAQLCGPADVYSFTARSDGFRAAAAAAGVDCVDVAGVDRLPTIEAGRALMARMLNELNGPRPTAIFAHNDTMAVGALAVMRERGLRCPDDISVIGYNDIPLTAYLDPPLSTVKLPGYELGRLAGELLATVIDGGEQQSGTVTLEPTLVVRSSTASV